jgi:periplasmic divalent cation tolerance protein
MTAAIQIITTAGTFDDAQIIARALVTRRLAACVQVGGPVTSTYYWQGNLESSQEWLCVIKTAESRYAEVEAAIRELHSYELPEIVAVPIVAGSQAYLDWLAAEVSGPPAAAES